MVNISDRRRSTSRARENMAAVPVMVVFPSRFLLIQFLLTCMLIPVGV